MFDYFGFDAKSLSDDELATKAAELQSKIVYASRFSSPGLLESMRGLMSLIAFEQHERIVRRAQTQIDSMFPAVIESDPDLAGKKEEAPERGRVASQPRPRLTITKTNRPADPGQSNET